MFKMWIITQLIGLLIMSIMAYIDFKYKKVSILWILTYIFIGIITAILSKITYNHIFLILIISSIFILISYITKQSLGFGDSLCIFGLLCFFKPYKAILILFLSFILTAICSLFLIFFKNKSKKYSLPYLVFLFISQLLSFLYKI